MYSNFTVEICTGLRQFEEIRKRLRVFEEIEITRQVEVTVNSREENLRRLSGFRHTYVHYIVHTYIKSYR